VKKRIMLHKIIVCLLLAGSLVSCSKSNDDPGSNPPPPPPPPNTGCAVGQIGPLFTAVKALVAQRCQHCHNANLANGGMNFQNECNIISNQTRMKVRAVDEGTMPADGPLSTADRKKITDWITAGGKYTD
jgi:uncharacterized membrane protein